MEKKRKFLFVSLTGLVGDIAWQVLKEGHEVRYFIGDEEEKDIADGFVPKTDDWEKDVDWADVIVFDDTLGQGEKAVELRKRGKAVVGGTPYTDRLEDDRSFGQEELKKAGVTIIPYKDFDNFDEAIAYVQENPTRYVIKPSGAAGNVKRRRESRRTRRRARGSRQGPERKLANRRGEPARATLTAALSQLPSRRSDRSTRPRPAPAAWPMRRALLAPDRHRRAQYGQ